MGAPNKAYSFIVVYFFLATLTVPSPAEAGGVGKIVGKIIAENTAEPLPMALHQVQICPLTHTGCARGCGRPRHWEEDIKMQN